MVCDIIHKHESLCNEKNILIIFQQQRSPEAEIYNVLKYSYESKALKVIKIQNRLFVAIHVTQFVKRVKSIPQ